MTGNLHEYSARLIWDGNLGEGTASYSGYSRQYRILVEGKPDIVGTADPAFQGDIDKHNPEDLFLTSIAACHMLFYLALCARKGVRVLAYTDDVHGKMILNNTGGGKFEEVILRPTVTIADEKNAALAIQLHETAHERCFIANSCNFRIHHQVTVNAQ